MLFRGIPLIGTAFLWQDRLVGGFNFQHYSYTCHVGRRAHDHSLHKSERRPERLLLLSWLIVSLVDRNLAGCKCKPPEFDFYSFAAFHRLFSWTGCGNGPESFFVISDSSLSAGFVGFNRDIIGNLSGPGFREPFRSIFQALDFAKIGRVPTPFAWFQDNNYIYVLFDNPDPGIIATIQYEDPTGYSE